MSEWLELKDLDKIKDEVCGIVGTVAYRPKNYTGPLVVDCAPSKEGKEYHQGASVRINFPDCK